jgi:hypothetical protein
LVTLNVIAAFFSFCGASFVVWNYWKFDIIRSKFTFKLILFVAVGDIINSLGNFMGSPDDGKKWRGVCILQAFLLQFGDIFSFCWVTSLSWIIYRSITIEEPPSPEDIARWYRNLHMIIWPTTLLLAVLPFIGNTYGPSGGFCWIKRGSTLRETWRWLCYYVPLWTCIIYMATVYITLWAKIRSMQSETGLGAQPEFGEIGHRQQSSGEVVSAQKQGSDGDMGVHHSDYDVSGAQKPSDSAVQSDAESEAAVKRAKATAVNRIAKYPIILFCCYFFATVRRIVERTSQGPAPVWLAAIQVVTSALLGFCNAMVFSMTPVVRKTNKEYFGSLCPGLFGMLGVESPSSEKKPVEEDELR